MTALRRLRDRTPTSLYFNRELSWVAFNRRMLYEASSLRYPLLDRVQRLAQVSRQIDEYFMVRIAALKQRLLDPQNALADPDDGLPRVPLHRIRAAVLPLLARQQAIVVMSLRPQLKAQGIHLVDYTALTEEQRAHVYRRFDHEIAPLLVPLITPPGKPIPDFSNLSLNLAVLLSSEGTSQLAWVKVPRILARFLPVGAGALGQPWVGVPLEQVITAHLGSLFPGFALETVTPFRVTRSADLGLIDTDTDNLLDTIQLGLQQRQQQGDAVRLEIGFGASPQVRSPLLAALALTPEDVYTPSGWLSYGDLMEVAQLPRSDLRSHPWKPRLPTALTPLSQRYTITFSLPGTVPQSLFALLQERDLLVHFPYHSFGATVEQFVAEAAQDPQVLAIKMTLYRTAGDAPLVRSLMAAAKSGKQVVVLVELTAALDEETNIHWALSLEKAGAHVVYGVVGMKTHTNLVMAVRQEGKQMRQYAYIGTGDYLPSRYQPYADLGLLTSNAQLGRDLSHLFNFLTGYSRPSQYQCLMVAPVTLRSRLMAAIAQEVQWAEAGQPARIIAKLNTLTDPAVIRALYNAAQAGVQIDLMVRGACCLRPGVPGLSDRIQVISLLGRYAEHSRILYCDNGGHPQAWIGSADWTTRGLDQRIEVMAPLLAPALLDRVIHLFDTWLRDTEDSWQLMPDGRYIPRSPAPNTPPFSAQRAFMTEVT